jgi:hypothetical protein
VPPRPRHSRPPNLSGFEGHSLRFEAVVDAIDAFAARVRAGTRAAAK